MFLKAKICFCVLLELGLAIVGRPDHGGVGGLEARRSIIPDRIVASEC